jgi:hypothetical protein
MIGLQGRGEPFRLGHRGVRVRVREDLREAPVERLAALFGQVVGAIATLVDLMRISA